LFDRGTVEGITHRLLRLLAAVVADPDAPLARVDLLGDTERSRMLEAGTGPVAEPVVLAPDLFRRQVERTPQAPAVAAGDVVLSYEQLSARVDGLARWLVEQGVGADSRVAVMVPRSVDLVVALLAVWRAGGAYVPVDADYPAERVRYVLEDADPVLVLSSVDQVGGAETVLPRLHAGQTAYVIYTSGSTGRPKGVLVPHGAVGAYLTRSRGAYPAAAGSALVHSSVAFDLTVTALYTPLVSGGCVYLSELSGDVPRPTFLKATPSHLTVLESLPDSASPSQTLILGGEQLLGEAVQRWRVRHPDALVINAYGPTEATVNCMEYRIEPGAPVASGPVPIGRP
ncbi:AMP-binding protein, partial [Jidongwangia harbinensis]|uniref:AMP-binding protein n=1 Tax=Jidongwangia harbinensis TaxID=2878561 RepID=UPI001CDA38B8